MANLSTKKRNKNGSELDVKESHLKIVAEEVEAEEEIKTEATKAAVKYWQEQPDQIIDLQHQSAMNISDLLEENKQLEILREKNLYAIECAKKSVLKVYGINARFISDVKFLKTEFGTFTLSEPQPPKLIESK